MSDHQITGDEKAGVTSTLSSKSLNVPNNHNHDPIAAFSGKMLDRSDSLIYAIVGVCFFLSGLFALGYSFWHFGGTILDIPSAIRDAAARHESATPQGVIANAIIQLISDLLLVLIIMEVLGTVTHYLKEHATSLYPFLFIGIISATRGILSIGARLSVAGSTMPPQEFSNSMIELGVILSEVTNCGLKGLKVVG